MPEQGKAAEEVLAHYELRCWECGYVLMAGDFYSPPITDRVQWCPKCKKKEGVMRKKREI